MSELVTYKAKITDADALQAAIDTLANNKVLECEYLGYGSMPQYTRSLGHQFAIKGKHYAFCVNDKGDIQIESMSDLKPQIDIVIQQYYVQLLKKRADKLGYVFSSVERANGDVYAQIFAGEKIIDITIPREGIATGTSNIVAGLEKVVGPVCSEIIDKIFPDDKAEKRETTPEYYETEIGVTAENGD